MDPFDLLDDEMLTDLTSQIEQNRQLKGPEAEMRRKLVAMLKEMDLDGEGRLDAEELDFPPVYPIPNADHLQIDCALFHHIAL